MVYPGTSTGTKTVRRFKLTGSGLEWSAIRKAVGVAQQKTSPRGLK